MEGEEERNGEVADALEHGDDDDIADGDGDYAPVDFEQPEADPDEGEEVEAGGDDAEGGDIDVEGHAAGSEENVEHEADAPADHMEPGGEEADVVDGGRHEAPKFDFMSRPPHGTDVFVGGLATDVGDQELQEFCEACGEIFEVRLIKDRSGATKGYGFVNYTTRDSAVKAVEELNDKVLKGRKVRVSLSQAKNRLFIGNIPKAWPKEELMRILTEEAVGLEAVELPLDPDTTRNRGFAFLEYYNHYAADHAIRRLTRPGFLLGGKPPTVNWAEPRPEVKVVYVKNLPDSVTDAKLEALFSKFGEIEKIVLPAPRPGDERKRDFGFVHFSSHNAAVAAVDRSERFELDGVALDVNLARSQDKRPPPTPQPERYVRDVQPIMTQPPTGPRYAGYSLSRNQLYVPEGMTMVPMRLPDGRVGYVLEREEVPRGRSSRDRSPARRTSGTATYSDRGGYAADRGGYTERGAAGSYSERAGYGERGAYSERGAAGSYYRDRAPVPSGRRYRPY